MAPRTSLQINTAAVVRLTKEQASYRKEQVEEEKRLVRLTDGGADEYEIKQQVGFLLPRTRKTTTLLKYYLLTSLQKKVTEQTAAMIPAVKKKLEETIEVLENVLVCAPFLGSHLRYSNLLQDVAPETESVESRENAKSAIAAGKAALEG